MKFKNIKKGMKIQHKETGEVYTVEFIGSLGWPVLDGMFYDCDGDLTRSVRGANDMYDGRCKDYAKLFRKYKEQK